ncbi:hypothetical protein GCM10017786_73970 [Amycolatopsis deserti]|uniref:Uncharacterized protein n=1 Tax=Amycolatopsis deserti TaxID=185696 RepID=A0ABQ3JFS2_9PSEU|nr:hypothetical protein [Amycolatopsis deserti]GHF29039.1 hypothetical protein GCM10017786_73970 [Amycolatopsis deserti]
MARRADRPRTSARRLSAARSPERVRANAAAAALEALPESTLAAVRELYDRRIRAQAHHRW